jgi:hypothetical protein
MSVEKSMVSVAEMARMVGLSRGRFYQLIGSTFPHPVYNVATKRPYYSEELQEACLAARRRNCGIDGRPALFYARRMPITPTTIRRPKVTAGRQPTHDHADLVEGLRSLGLFTATAAQVGAAMKQLYPSGVNGTGQGEVLRSVFLHLRAQGSER